MITKSFPLFRCVAAGMLSLSAMTAQAALFEDEEARRAILDLRQKVEALRQDSDKRVAEEAKRVDEESSQLRRSILDLQNQIDSLRGELAQMRGQNEQLARDVANMQRSQKDVLTAVEERLRQVEPVRVTQDGREFTVVPEEKRAYEAALAVFRKGDFAAAETAFVEFLTRYAQSGYAPSAYFWLGNAGYALRNYKEAIQNFRTLISLAPDHLRAPEAVLSIANCQIELKDTKAARKTLEDLIKAYPRSEAASAAKQRLSRLK